MELPTPPAGGRDLRGRIGPHDGGGQPPHPTTEVRPGGAAGRSQDGAGRGRRKKHDRLPSVRRPHVESKRKTLVNGGALPREALIWSGPGILFLHFARST